jgi:magnesium and cobalt transporter
LKNKKLETKAAAIMRPVTFVPDSQKVEKLLTEFEGAKVPMAIVVNEYSETVGLVTVEDILEEIVGEIFDKSRLNSLYIKTINKKLIRVDSRASMEEINRVLHLGFENEPFRTFAGFIEHKFQKIPRQGEKLRLKNIIIEIAEANQRGIKSVLVRKA